ncbi:hypothetical protein MKX01_028936 [Papaver californicum]|nr:hypothetical protein MKX01_028936 [Papaver californicum]
MSLQGTVEFSNHKRRKCRVDRDCTNWSLIANLSATNCYKSEHLNRLENWALVSPESIQFVSEHVVAQNKIFAMNLSAPFICEFFRCARESSPEMDQWKIKGFCQSVQGDLSVSDIHQFPPESRH